MSTKKTNKSDLVFPYKLVFPIHFDFGNTSRKKCILSSLLILIIFCSFNILARIKMDVKLQLRIQFWLIYSIVFLSKIKCELYVFSGSSKNHRSQNLTLPHFVFLHMMPYYQLHIVYRLKGLRFLTFDWVVKTLEYCLLLKKKENTHTHAFCTHFIL